MKLFALLVLSAAKAPSPAPLFIGIGVLALFVIAGAIVLVQLRKKLIDHPNSPTGKNALPFTLDELRRMHRDGLLSDVEFEKAKQQLILAAGHRPSASVGAPKDPPAA